MEAFGKARIGLRLVFNPFHSTNFWHLHWLWVCHRRTRIASQWHQSWQIQIPFPRRSSTCRWTWQGRCRTTSRRADFQWFRFQRRSLCSLQMFQASQRRGKTIPSRHYDANGERISDRHSELVRSQPCCLQKLSDWWQKWCSERIGCRKIILFTLTFESHKIGLKGRPLNFKVVTPLESLRPFSVEGAIISSNMWEVNTLKILMLWQFPERKALFVVLWNARFVFFTILPVKKPKWINHPNLWNNRITMTVKWIET